MAKITYEDKEFLNKNENIADKNKVNDTDLNEIKEVVNGNDDNIGNLSNLNTTNKDSLVGAINEKKLNKLWENPEPSNVFNAQTITLANDNYDYLVIFYKLNRGLSSLMSTMSIKGYGFTLNGGGNSHVSGSSNYVGSTYLRDCQRISDTQYKVPLAYVYVGNSTTQGSDPSTYLIPVFIYGGKF